MTLEELRARHPTVSLVVHERTEGIVLARLVVPPAERGRGVGSSVLRDIMTYADRVGKPVVLTPEPTDLSVESPGYAAAVARLMRFYARFGFVPNKGRRKDFQFREVLIRQPKERTTETKP